MSEKEKDMFKGVNKGVIREIKGLIEELKKVDEKEQEKIAKKIRSFVESDVKEEKDEKGKFEPKLRELEIVAIKYTGVGTELNNKHYGVVLKVNKNRGAVVIIPLTSKIKENLPMKFELGDLKVEDMPKKDSIIDISGLSEVSRKRIIKLEQQENPITKKMEYPTLNREKHYDDILNGIVVNYCKLKTVENFLLEECPEFMPKMLNEYEDMRHWGIRSPKFDPETNELIFYKWNKEKQDKIQLIKSKKPITKEKRWEIIKGLRMIDKNIYNEALALYNEFYI